MKRYGIAGWKNSGKTGLVTRLLAHFTDAGLRVSTIKHAHHAFDVDHDGRDSYRHRQAGAEEVLVASSARVALMTELRGADEPDLEDLIRRLSPVDLVLIEGYKAAPHPKIETFRSATRHAPIAERNETIRAIATDAPGMGLDLPEFSLDDTAGIARFIRQELDL